MSELKSDEVVSRLKKLKIGYVPYSENLDAPGDRRRFVYYARKNNIPFEVADPSKRYDIVILSGFADLTVWSKYRRGVLVFDLIDSYLDESNNSFKDTFRGTAKWILRKHRYWEMDYKKTIKETLLQCRAAVCCTVEQQRLIKEFCPEVHIILDIHNSSTKTVKTSYEASSPVFNIVWEGLPYTMETLKILKGPLEKIQKTHPVALHIITDLEYYKYARTAGKTLTQKEAAKIFANTFLYSWNESTVSSIITSCDMAVIPLRANNALDFGKPENKLLLFWRMGMPVLTSDTPAYTRAMARCGSDMACGTEDEWVEKLLRYIMSADARKEAAEKGMRYASTEHGEDVTLARWDKLFSIFMEKGEINGRSGIHNPLVVEKDVQEPASIYEFEISNSLRQNIDARIYDEWRSPSFRSDLTPRLSVVMPIYNGEKYLADSLRSLLAQSFEDFEVVLVDDGSRDRGPEIVKSFSNIPIKMVKQINGGIGSALRTGCQIARAEWIARMDQDDVALPDRFLKQMAYLEKNPKIGLLGTGVIEINSFGEETGKYIFPSENDDIKRLLIVRNMFLHPTTIFKKSIYEEVGGYSLNRDMPEDWDLWIRMIDKTQVANLSECLLMYRRHDKSISIVRARHYQFQGIKLRGRAILEGRYSFYNLIYIIFALLGLILPMNIVAMIRKRIHKHYHFYPSRDFRSNDKPLK